MNLKEVVENLVENFLEAGDLAIQLREMGLINKSRNSLYTTEKGELLLNSILSHLLN